MTCFESILAAKERVQGTIMDIFGWQLYGRSETHRCKVPGVTTTLYLASGYQICHVKRNSVVLTCSSFRFFVQIVQLQSEFPQHLGI